MSATKSNRQTAQLPRGRRLHVALAERPYDVLIQYDAWERAGREIAKRTGASQVALVTVPQVGRRYAAKLTRSLRAAGLRVHRFEVPDGDGSKNLAQVAKLYDAFLDKGMDRSSAVVALGGGVVGDLAGFAAASFLRGIPFVQVPTSLLAMVDASIGGKTGVNLEQGKNLVGAFHQPKLVWIDPSTLRSLPKRQVTAGMAELIKHAAILDAKFFKRLEQCIDSFMDLDPAVLVPVLERGCAIKVEVVVADEFEAGSRALLNFGHTLAHAVEKLSGYGNVLHGEAVAMGMVFAARRSEELGLAPAGTRERLEALIRRTGLPTALPEFPRKAYLSAIRVDKKARDGRVRFVALRGIGNSETVPLTAAEIYPSRR